MQRAGTMGWAAATIAGLVWACSSTPAPPYPDVTSFVNAIAKAECQEAANCNTPAAQCQTERAQIWQTAAGAIGPNRAYKPDNAPDAVTLATSTYGASGNPRITPAQIAAVQDKFEHAFPGTVSLGAACVTKYDCANYDSAGLDCINKVCAAPVTVAPGPTGYCTEPNQICAQGSYCGPTGVCVTDATLGQPCGLGVLCGSSLHCVAGVCAQRGGQGDLCTTSDDCDPSVPFCDIYDPPARCSLGEIFAPAETLLCSQFGGSTTPITPPAPDAGTTPADAGTTPDTGAPATDAGSTDAATD